MNTPAKRWVKDRNCVECNAPYVARSYNHICCGHECYKKRQSRNVRIYYSPPAVAGRKKIRPGVYAAGISDRTHGSDMWTWPKDEFGNPFRQVGDIGRRT